MTEVSGMPRRAASRPLGMAIRAHHAVFTALEGALAGWFNGFAARFAFASLLLLYYLNSAWNKLGEGLLGFLHPSTGAYASILPSVMEQYGYDPAAIPFFPWHGIVLLGTWTELLLPVLIVVGLFTRISAIGMAIFIVVQSYVDVMFHGLEGKYVGSMFDRFPDAIIWDQRMLWIFLLVMIVANGPGKVSVDHLLARRYREPS